MADFNQTAAQVQPQGLWNGLFQQPQPQIQQPPQSSDYSMLDDEHKRRMGDRLFLREINPGVTWGGRDRNAIQPNDVMGLFFSPTPPGNI